MQEKHLPFFRQPQERNPKRADDSSLPIPATPAESNENQEFFDSIRPATPASSYKSGPNLIFQDERTPYNAEFLRVFSSMFQRASLAILLIFGGLLVANYYFTLKLESSRVVLDSLAGRLDNYNTVKQQALEVDKKINFYEKTLSERAALGERTSFIFSSLGSTVVLQNASIDLQKFTLDLKIGTPLEFAKLINTYLATDFISTITLKSADLDPNKQQYRVVMEGTF